MKKLVLTDGREPEEVEMTDDEIAAVQAVRLPVIIPAISRRQLRLWLLTQGKTDADVRAAIAAIPDGTARAAALIEWEDSTSYERGHPLIAAIGNALGFTAEQIDAGFVAAATI